jgi:hypothetical protein
VDRDRLEEKDNVLEAVGDAEMVVVVEVDSGIDVDIEADAPDPELERLSEGVSEIVPLVDVDEEGEVVLDSDRVFETVVDVVCDTEPVCEGVLDLDTPDLDHECVKSEVLLSGLVSVLPTDGVCGSVTVMVSAAVRVCVMDRVCPMLAVMVATDVSESDCDEVAVSMWVPDPV